MGIWLPVGDNSPVAAIEETLTTGYLVLVARGEVNGPPCAVLAARHHQGESFQLAPGGDGGGEVDVGLHRHPLQHLHVDPGRPHYIPELSPEVKRLVDRLEKGW